MGELRSLNALVQFYNCRFVKLNIRPLCLLFCFRNKITQKIMRKKARKKNIK